MFRKILDPICDYLNPLMFAIKKHASYGCYCGAGTNTTANLPTMDAFDKICKEHDDCYNKANLTASCSEHKDEVFYHPPKYHWSKNDSQVICLWACYISVLIGYREKCYIYLNNHSLEKFIYFSNIVLVWPHE